MPLCCGLVFYLFDPFLICALHVVLMIRHKRLNHARQHFTVAAQIVGGINYVKLKLLKCSSLLWEMIWCHTPEAVLRCFSPSIQTFISALTGTSTSDKMCHSHSVRAVLSQSRGIRLVLMTSHMCAATQTTPVGVNIKYDAQEIKASLILCKLSMCNKHTWYQIGSRTIVDSWQYDKRKSPIMLETR